MVKTRRAVQDRRVPEGKQATETQLGRREKLNKTKPTGIPNLTNHKTHWQRTEGNKVYIYSREIKRQRETGER